MGRTFEELVREFNETANEEAGTTYPREVIRLMVDLLFLPDNDILLTSRGTRKAI